MKKIIIAQHNGGQLANQLWNFAQIYGYCLEKGFQCENWSFFEYHKFFEIPPPKNRLVYFFFFKTFESYSFFLPFRIARKIGRIFYGIFVKFLKILKKGTYFFTGHDGDFYYLPPTKESEGRLKELEENEKIKTIYLEGWTLRNPKGTEKYQKEIREFFKIKEIYKKKVDKTIESFRQKYKQLVGVHIRQKGPGDGDFKDIDGQKVYIHKEDISLVKKTLRDYLSFFQLKPKEVIFIFCSNKKVDLTQLKELNCYFSGMNPIEDLYLLSQTDIIFACKSTFSAFASYYNQIPLIIFSQGGINWKKINQGGAVKALE